ncbi:carboxylating nicotinate-nucleotide diphosphorylase [Ferruginibacter albus]|uniref:carboxylating nicotinate-nucleotide diphosphorylase n=1 Tax=Ferruginibacter albus TaxID=2875540 RepID=UPI001CC7E140|nr:carboxylating nicotinate-nucleotide diphosphorylase [Ferruginibacter albus]
MNYDLQLEHLIKEALAEDIGDGDHSTISSIDKNAVSTAVLKIKEAGILAGMSVAEKIFRQVQPDIVFTGFKKDGEAMQFGETAFEVSGLTHTILKTERLVLNCMQRMSGIATLTKQYTDKLKPYKTKLLDTRKATPNFRLLEKEAVRIGGGVNHRFGLFDMIMLKDNHIDAAGDIVTAIERAYQYVQQIKPGLKIEVETRNIDDVAKALSTKKVDRIMLDNFIPQQITEALQLINGACETEASGGINLHNIEEYAATGVDYISSGAVIHHAVSLDLSLKIKL